MMIREARPEDSEWVLHHRIGMFRAMGESEEFIKKTEALVRDYLSGDWTNNYRYFLIEIEGRIAGGCGLSTLQIPPLADQVTGVYGYVSNMFVEPDLRGKGLGKRLMNHVVEFCRESGIGLLILHSSRDKTEFYKSLGFTNSRFLMHLIIREP
jgi:GNAT superfamily N-acetyltransferase